MLCRAAAAYHGVRLQIGCCVLTRFSQIALLVLSLIPGGASHAGSNCLRFSFELSCSREESSDLRLRVENVCNGPVLFAPESLDLLCGGRSFALLLSSRTSSPIELASPIAGFCPPYRSPESLSGGDVAVKSNAIGLMFSALSEVDDMQQGTEVLIFCADTSATISPINCGLVHGCGR